MDPTEVAARMSQVDEAVVIGDKPAHTRPALGMTRLGALAHGLLIAGALATSAAVIIDRGQERGHFSGPVQTATAQVSAKMMLPGAKDLPESKTGGAWQPASQAQQAKHYLILDMGNQNGAVPVVIAVSASTYDRYCKHLKESDMMGDMTGNTANGVSGGCGAVHTPNQPTPAHIALDTLQVSYTRNLFNGEIEVRQINGQGKMASGFLERFQLRQQLKPVEVADVAPTRSTPKHGQPG